MADKNIKDTKAEIQKLDINLRQMDKVMARLPLFGARGARLSVANSREELVSSTVEVIIQHYKDALDQEFSVKSQIRKGEIYTENSARMAELEQEMNLQNEQQVSDFKEDLKIGLLRLYDEDEKHIEDIRGRHALGEISESVMNKTIEKFEDIGAKAEELILSSWKSSIEKHKKIMEKTKRVIDIDIAET